MILIKLDMLHSVVLLLLLGSLLIGCAIPTKLAHSNAIPPNEGHNTMQLPIRAIIYFQRPTADSKQLSAAISKACRCQPVFFRQYRDEALIYELALPQGQTFVSFEKSLMQNAVQLGIKAVEQDRIMQHQ